MSPTEYRPICKICNRAEPYHKSTCPNHGSGASACSQIKLKPKVHDFRTPSKRINTLEDAFKRAENAQAIATAPEVEPDKI
jgi:hypothetical protein